MNDDLHDRAVKWCKGRTYFGAETLITDLAAALRAAETNNETIKAALTLAYWSDERKTEKLRAAETDLATARTALRELLNTTACSLDNRNAIAVRKRAAAVLASVAATPTTPEEP